MNKKQLEEFRELLLAEQQRIQGLIDGTKGEIRVDDSEEYNQAGGAAAHPADAATEVYDREQAMSLARDWGDRLREIEHALSKIDDGTYGVSEGNGKPIPRDRLRIVPWARLTIQEERELERQQAL